MAHASIANLRGMCGGPRDGALLRVSLANALLFWFSKMSLLAIPQLRLNQPRCLLQLLLPT
jgi:hypothetical protein